jgi:PAS domain S-box-containing protein
MVEDVTERKRIQEELEKNERRYRELFEDSPIALCEIDISAVKQYVASLKDAEAWDMRTYLEHHPEAVLRCAALMTVVDMNNAMLELFGADTQEDLRKNLPHIFHEESYNHFREDILMFMADRKSYEHESVAQTLAGEKVHIYLKWFSAAGYDEAGSRIIVSFIDITELKRAEKSLKESREWFRKLVETMNEGLGIQDEKGVITYVNERFCRMVGYTQDELIGRHLSGLLDETNRKILEKHIANREKGDKTPYDLRWTKKSGEFIYTVISPQPLFDESGQYKGSFATLTDITDRKQLEKSLKESEDRFRITLHNSPIVVFNQDRNLRFTWIYNPRHGHTQEDVIGKTDSDVCEVENLAWLIEIKQCVIENGVSQKEEVGIRYGGEILYYDSYFEPLYDPDGSIIGLTGVAIDITKRKRQEKLIRSYQEQLSLLASKLSLVEEKERRRIAKDLHDNIGQILACAKLKLGELNKSCNADCNQNLKQICGLVEQSILYTRSLTAELSVPILYEMGLEPAVAWLGREFQKNHAVQFHLSDDSASKPLNDDIRIVLFKAVRELLTNVAKHAHAKNVTVSLQRKDGTMQVTVEDDGVGFDVADIQKSPRIQTCFGLFSIREALKNSGGSIEIDSAPGRTTRVTLTAPLEVTSPNPLLHQEGE